VGPPSPVVFVHGSASDYRTWIAQLNELGKRYNAIVYSRRYHWPNERMREGADLLDMYEDGPAASNASVLSFLTAHDAG
jgi:pimeloyl-ACP methyl ester carboxylesterase